MYYLNARDVEKHSRKHRAGQSPPKKKAYCPTCYPPTSIDQQTAAFQNFWAWIQVNAQAASYTRYTTEAFQLLQENFYTIPYINILAVIRRLCKSIRFTVTPVRPLETLSTAIYAVYHNTGFHLPPSTEPLPEEPTENTETVETEIEEVPEPIELSEVIDIPEEIMDAEALKQLLAGLLRPEGLNLKKNEAGNVFDRKELSLVKVEPFYGKESEDPYEWMELFDRAAAANNWQTARLSDICAGFLREAAKDWFLANKDLLNQWGT